MSFRRDRFRRWVATNLDLRTEMVLHKWVRLLFQKFVLVPIDLASLFRPISFLGCHEELIAGLIKILVSRFLVTVCQQAQNLHIHMLR